DSGFGQDLVAGMSGGVVSASLRSVGGETLRKNDYLSVAADAFGNALGNKAARTLEVNSGSAKVNGINRLIAAQDEPYSWDG
ncbi:hypothetical protein, partial [Tritonibacter sp. SIMBA_163]|uniref:hypothetical protein n=1 Tax=Tritonibacter sp. SIMBA_163 TaxID=3080868 RepID=UPI00397E9259